MTLASGTAWRKIVGTGPGAAATRSACWTSAPASCAATSPGRGRDQGVQLLGRGYQVAEGLKGGDVVDAEAAEAAILGALHEAEQQAGETLREIYLAVSGGRVQSSSVRVDSRCTAAASPSPACSSCSTARAARPPRPTARCCMRCRWR